MTDTIPALKSKEDKRIKDYVMSYIDHYVCRGWKPSQVEVKVHGQYRSYSFTCLSPNQNSNITAANLFWMLERSYEDRLRTHRIIGRYCETATHH